jgi:hypothetical protein
MTALTGRCLCGAIRFRTTATPAHVSACHCSQCRRQSGNYWASANVPAAALEITGEPRWYEATPTARRGFCPTCGSFLFWQGTGSDTIAFALGAVDGHTHLRLDAHIFTASKGDWYDLADGVLQHP